MKVIPLSVELPCSKFLPDGGRCFRPTRWGLSYETTRGETIIFPYCKVHLPDSVKIPSGEPEVKGRKPKRKEGRGKPRRR